MKFEFYLDAWKWAQDKMTFRQFNKKVKKTGFKEWTINVQQAK